MKKVSLSQCATLPSDYGFIMKPFFGPDTKPKEAVHMGYAVFTPGMKAPPEGTAIHDGDEFSYIIKGSIKCCVNGETVHLQAGDAAYIPAGEAHYSYNETAEECALVYMLVKTI